MDPALSNLGWTEDQWNRICSVVSEEAQRARVCAQALPVVGLDDPSAIAIPSFRLAAAPEPYPYGAATQRLTVDSDPTLFITTIAINVPLRSHEMNDPQLSAALGMFRRAANNVAHLEDALFIHGRTGASLNAPTTIPAVFTLSGSGNAEGVFSPTLPTLPPPPPTPPINGNDMVDQIVAAIGLLEAQGQTGPYACLLSAPLFNFICTPQAGLVLPRDRILPFLQGPLLRSADLPAGGGCLFALGGSPTEVVIASDINVRYLQTTPEPRYVFRVSERVALRVKEPNSIVRLG
jgi:uncharacterized linocin/CFP29 family protein